MSEQMADQRRKRKGRSPSYPGIGLREAIEKAEALYEREGRHAAPIDVITNHWGYKSNTGPGLVAIAALKKFGLLEDEGDGNARRGRLTERALSIVLGAPNRQRLVQEAALEPPIHAQLWEEYDGQLPSEQTLRHVLVVDRAFTDSGARQFIRQFRDTIAFARLDEPDIMPEAQPPQHRSSGEATVPRTSSVGFDAVFGNGTARPSAETEDQPNVRTLQLPIEAPVWPVLRVPYPMTEEAWDQMLDAINVFKRGVVRKATADDQSSPQPSPSDPE